MRSSSRYAAMLAAVLLGGSGCGGGNLTLPGEEIGPPANLIPVSGNEQEAAAGAPVPDSLVVRLVDAQGTGVPEEAISWVIGTGGGSVAPGSGETGAGGLANASWVLGPDPGPNTVTAVVAGLPVVVFSASGTGSNGGGGGGGGGGDGGGDGGGIARLAFIVQPTDTKEDERIRPAVVVAIVDEDGLRPDLSAKIELSLAAGAGELDGKREADTRNGFAVFDDLKIKDAGSGFVLRASASKEPELGSVDSRAFDIHED